MIKILMIRSCPYPQSTPCRRIKSFIFSMDLCHRRFDIFQRQLKLLGISLLGPYAKQGPLEVSNQFLQLIDAILLAQIAVL